VVFRDPRGYERKIDFIQAVHELKASEVEETAIPSDVLDSDGSVVPVDLRIMHPVLCLESRAYNVIKLPSIYDNEHGIRQLRASICCAREFIRELLGEGQERNARKLVERVFRFSTRQTARRLHSGRGIDVFQAVAPDPRFCEAFRTKRYPQMVTVISDRCAKALGPR
jgi:hypothetical protein